MKKVYHKYTDWEDFKNGMYDSQKDKPGNFDAIMELMSNKDLLLNTCALVLSDWKICVEENLTNKDINRVAWLGQACVNYKHNISEKITKLHWKNLPLEVQINANETVKSVILNYEKSYNYLHPTLDF